MQATSIFVAPAVSNNVESAGEVASSGLGIRVNSAQQTKSGDSLFTAILQQGITLKKGPGLLTGNGNSSGTGTSGKKETDNAVDVCGLLMQLMMMNGSVALSAAETGEGTEPEKQNIAGILGLTAGSAEQAAAAAALLGGNGTAVPGALTGGASNVSEILSQLLGAGTSESGAGAVSSAPAQGGDVFSAITAALKSNLIQNAQETAGQASAPAVSGQASVSVSGQTAAEAEQIVAGLRVMTAAAEAKQSSAPTAASSTDGQTQADGTASSAAGAGKADALVSGITAQEAQSDTSDGKSDSSMPDIGAREKNKTAVGETFVTTGAGQTVSGASYGGTAEKTAAVEKALNEFTEDFRGLQSGTQEIKIVLEPESLGVMTITVAKTPTGISAKIKSEDKEIVAAISTHLQKLISTMETKGVHIDDVDVVYGQTDQNTGFGQSTFNQSGHESPKGHYSPGFDKNQNTEAQNGSFWQEYHSEGKSDDSTVEYRV